MRAEEAKHMPPHWNSYVSVTSADQSAAKARELGATLLMEPFDVMDLGRMAVIQDPTGAAFCLWEGKKNIGVSLLGAPGSLIWTELMTSDTAKAKAFYTGLLPWNAADFPMPDFVYTRFQRGEEGAAGMMQVPHPSIPPHWMPYFGVANCDESFAKATELGAETIMPIKEMPGTGKFAILKDPQGAPFSIFQSLR
jgi:predicted enzyme related to lactoylglutathione lyase